MLKDIMGFLFLNQNMKNKLKSNFSIIANEIALTNKLSAKAKGVYLYLICKPENWVFYETEIASHFKDGKSAINSAIKELIKVGYLKRFQVRESGKFSHYDYEIISNLNGSGKTESGKTESGKSDYGKSDYEKSATINTNTNNTNISNTNTNNTFNNSGSFLQKTTPKKTILQRKEDFKEKIRTFVNDYDKEELIKFYEYWSEAGDNDKKMKFEKINSFNCNLRIKKWFANKREWQKDKTSQSTSTLKQTKIER